MLDNVIVFRQSSIKITRDKVLYFDPFKIEKEYKDADIIFITHDHFDHFDLESINKVKKDTTKIVIPYSLKDKVLTSFKSDNVLLVEPDKSYTLDNIKFDTVRAYNNNKKFHPKENNWVGYLLYLDNYKYYVMGDTDDTVDARSVAPDILFVPIGGMYTMDVSEAINYTNYVKPKIAVPIHYGEVVGSKEDGEEFINGLDETIKGVILINKE